MSVSYCYWELLDSGSIQHSYNVMKALPTANTQQAAFGSEYVADLEKPECTYTLQAENISREALQPLRRAAMGRNVRLTVADKNNRTYTGRVASLTWEAIPGTESYKATLQLRHSGGETALTGVVFTDVNLSDFNDAANGGGRAQNIIQSAGTALNTAGAENV